MLLIFFGCILPSGVPVINKAEVIEILKKSGLADGQTPLRFADDSGFADITIPETDSSADAENLLVNKESETPQLVTTRKKPKFFKMPENPQLVTAPKNSEFGGPPEAPPFIKPPEVPSAVKATQNQQLSWFEDDDTPPPFEQIMRVIRAGQSDKATFRRVSELSWDYTDDFDEDVYIPSGANTWKYMSVDQLHSYFYHRKQFKNGIFITKFPTYIYIYISEVLLRDNAPAQLAFILSNTAHKYPNIKSDICRYIKDCYIVNDIDVPFYTYLTSFGAEDFFQSYKPDDMDSRNALGDLFSSSDYDISRSKFISDHPDMRDRCRELFDCVLENAAPLFEIYGISAADLVRSDAGETEYYYPFTGVLYCGEFKRTNEAKLSSTEVYKKRGAWFVRSVVYTPKSTRVFAGFLLKSIENKLREKNRFGYLLKLDADDISNDIAGYGGSKTTDRLANIVRSGEFSAIIREVCETDGTVNPVPTAEKLLERMNSPLIAAFRRMKRVEVNADAMFREEMLFKLQSEEIAELTVPEDEAANFRTVTNHHIRSLDEMDTPEFEDYVYWRTRVKSGLVAPLSTSFERLYISEIVNDSHLSPIEKVETLAEFIRRSLETESDVKSREKCFAAWLKDLYLCNAYQMDKNGSVIPFYDIIVKYNLVFLYPEHFINTDDQSNMAEAIVKLAGDGLKKSKFFLPETKELLFRTIYGCFNAMCAMLTEAGIDPDELFIERVVTDFRPFDKGILYFPVVLPAHLKIVLSPGEYITTDRHNHFTRVAIEPERKLLPLICTFLVREVEKALRNAVGFGGKVSTLTNFKERFAQKLERKYSDMRYTTIGRKSWLAAESILCSDSLAEMYEDLARYILKHEFPDIVIAKPPKKTAVKAPEPPPEPIPIKVEVDFQKLVTIRSDAEDIAKKLIIDESESKVTSVPQSTSTDKPAQYKIHNITATPHITPEPIVTAEPATATTTEAAKTHDSGDPYKDFVNALDEDSRILLNMISSGKSTADCEAFLRSKNKMPEVAINAINEKALEYTGDIVLEDFSIIEDYKEIIKAIM
jgi:hypothetical protein